MRDEFLSEEDLDLKTMTDEELYAYWNAWLEQAQITNDADARTYSHGVFLYEPRAEDDPAAGLTSTNSYPACGN
jgi:hypothetical protein